MQHISVHPKSRTLICLSLYRRVIIEVQIYIYDSGINYKFSTKYDWASNYLALYY